MSSEADRASRPVGGAPGKNCRTRRLTSADMRLLHTSDWHLGRMLHRADLSGAQAAFVDHLVETVHTERVDVVLVSGDVYDRALPPVEAVSLFDEALHPDHRGRVRGWC